MISLNKEFGEAIPGIFLGHCEGAIQAYRRLAFLAGPASSSSRNHVMLSSRFPQAQFVWCLCLIGVNFGICQLVVGQVEYVDYPSHCVAMSSHAFDAGSMLTTAAVVAVPSRLPASKLLVIISYPSSSPCHSPIPPSQNPPSPARPFPRC